MRRGMHKSQVHRAVLAGMGVRIKWEEIAADEAGPGRRLRGLLRGL